MVICSSLNDSAHDILNDVLKIKYGLVGSLLFSGFSVFDPPEFSLSNWWHGNVCNCECLIHPKVTQYG